MVADAIPPGLVGDSRINRTLGCFFLDTLCYKGYRVLIIAQDDRVLALCYGSLPL